jgi:serine/threonine protein kinase/tetratricopeptide (TPR) repeat protein
MRICPRCNTPSLKDHAICPFCGAPMGSGEQAMQDGMVGQIVSDKFVLRELIGSGGMGKVYRADQLGVGRTVAVKIMHRHLMGDETAGARFTNEARAASQLNHPNSISVLDFGQTVQGYLYIVYEYLRGRSLDVLLRDDFPIPLGRVADITCQALDAVEAAHRLGIIHRDLKPENVFLVQTGGQDFVKVLDFGIAKIQAQGDRSITSPGMVPGTPEYMSPEQARGEPLEPTSDVYAVGILLYELLTATVPFCGPSVVATMMSHVQDEPEPPSERRPDRQIPKELEEITMWALSKRPENRIGSAEQFRDLLANWAQTAGVWRVQAPEWEQPLPPGSYRRSRQSIEGKVFVGRSSELAWLEQLLSTSRDHKVLRIHGPVGTGKSRLVQEVLRRNVASAVRVIHCGPDPTDTPVPLGVARKAAMGCLGLENEAAGVEDLLLAASRIGLPPEEIHGIQDIFEIPGHLSEMPAANRRRERACAFRQLVRRAAAQWPLLLVFESLQEADGPSRELVVSLAAGLEDVPVRLLVTHTPELELEWPEGVEDLAVGPLDEQASSELVQALFDRPVEESQVNPIQRVSEGQPLFLEQMAYARFLDGETDVPERLADLLAMRAERLPLKEREILQTIAVHGGWVTARSLSRLGGGPVEKKLLEGLVEKGLLRAEDGGRDRYAFVHPLVGMVVYSSIPAEVRRGIHQRVSEHLRRQNAPATLLAYHAFEADTELAAIEELQQAGAQAMQCIDYHSASQHFSRALQMVRKEWGKGRLSEEEVEGLAVGLARRLADTLRQSEEPQMARGVLEEALSVAASRDSSRAELRFELGRIDLEHGHLQRAARHLELARTDAEAGGSDQLLGEVLRELGRAVGLQGEQTRAGQLLEASLAASRKARGPRGDVTWATLFAVADACSQVGLADRTLGYLLDALQEAESARSIPGKLLTTMEMALVHLAANEWDEAEMRLGQGLELAVQVGDRTSEVNLFIQLGRFHRIRGNAEQGRTALERAIGLANSIGFDDGRDRAGQEIEMLKYATPQSL